MPEASTEDTPQDWESPAPAEDAPAETKPAEDTPAETVPDEAAGTAETKPLDTKPAETIDLEAERKRIEEDRKEINRTAYEVRKLKEKLKEKEAAAAAPKPEDIEPKMKLQIYKQIAKQTSKGTEVKATEAIEIKNIKEQQDSYLARNWPDITKEDSELRGHLDKAKSILRVEDSPFSDFLAMGSLMLARMPEFIKAAEERGRAAAMPDNRKKAIKDGKPPAGGTPPNKQDEPAESNNYGLSAEQMEVAKKNFGFTKPQQFKWYSQNLKSARS
jgi:hypothetical protein